MSASNNTVNIVTGPQEFFRERIHHATNALSLKIEDEVEFYIVNLLCDFIDHSKLAMGEEREDVLSQPLAMMLKNAMDAPREKRPVIFKRMGDTSLYIAGYFQDYFNRKTYDINYYIEMGKTAYSNLSELMHGHPRDEPISQVYHSMASQFSDLVEIVAIASDLPNSATTNDNILAIYDRWNQTRSERLRRRLAANGIEPIAVTRKAQ